MESERELLHADNGRLEGERPSGEEHTSTELLVAGGLLGRATLLMIGLDERMTIVSFVQRHPGLARPNAVGRPLAEVFPDAPELIRAARAALQEREERTTLLGLADRRFMVEMLPIQGDRPEHLLVILIELDVLADELRAREAERNLIFAQLPAVVWTTDRDLRVTRVSGSLLRTLKLRTKPLGARVDQVFGHQAEAMAEVLANHRAALEGEPRRFHLTVARRTFDVTLEPLRSNNTLLGCVGCAVDITGWMAREQRLADSEKVFSQAQRIAHVGSWDWDLRHDRLQWSVELFRIYGIDPLEFDGTSQAYLRYQHPGDRAHVRKIVARALTEGHGFEYEHRIVRRGGEVRKLLTRGEVELEGGRAVRMIGTSVDITDRWIAEQERERSVSLLRATVESTADGILAVDRHGRVSLYNRKFAEMWHIPASIKNVPEDEAALSIAAPQLEDPAGFLARVQELYRHPEEESQDVLRFKDGRVYERFSRPQRLGGEIVGRVWSFRDVTEHERLLRRAVFLADSSRLLASLEAEQAAEAVAHLALPLLGEVCALDLIPDEEGPRRLFSVAISLEPACVGDPPAAALAGSSLVFELNGISSMAVPLRTRDAILGVLTFCAQPGRRYLRADLDLAEELAGRMTLSFDNARLFRQAREALRTRDEFLSVAAHELRGPATALKLLLHGLASGATPEAQRARMFELSERQVKHIARFVDELLDVTRLRSQQMHVELEEVDLAAVAREVAARMTDEINRSGSPLTLEASVPVVGKWDRLRLEQLATNLLGNALKFGRGQPVELTVRAEGDRAVLQVTDRGIGIPKGQQDLIFQAFERAVSSRHYGGLGLGLYISKAIVDALGGSLKVESTPGQGSTFTATLPRGGSET